MLRLGQVAWALGVHEKTADNAIRTLGLRRPLDEDTVRALGLALRAKHRYGIPLTRAFPLLRSAMIRPSLRETDAVVREVLSYLPDIERGIRHAVERYRPLRRGAKGGPRGAAAPAGRTQPALRRALQWGLDLSLNAFSLRHTAEERLLALSENARALHALRGERGTMNLVAMWEGLARAGVRFVAIGGVAGNAHGSARVTNDLDVCYDAATDNTERLVQLLNAWHARLHVAREPGARLPFVIDRRTFRDAPALTLETEHGRLDLLPVVTGVGDYRACLAASEVMQVGGVELRVLSLDALIRAKRAAGRPRDLEHLIELEALRAMRKAAPGGGRTREQPTAGAPQRPAVKSWPDEAAHGRRPRPSGRIAWPSPASQAGTPETTSRRPSPVGVDSALITPVQDTSSRTPYLLFRSSDDDLVFSHRR